MHVSASSIKSKEFGRIGKLPSDLLLSFSSLRWYSRLNEVSSPSFLEKGGRVVVEDGEEGLGSPSSGALEGFFARSRPLFSGTDCSGEVGAGAGDFLARLLVIARPPSSEFGSRRLVATNDFIFKSPSVNLRKFRDLPLILG